MIKKFLFFPLVFSSILIFSANPTEFKLHIIQESVSSQPFHYHKYKTM